MTAQFTASMLAYCKGTDKTPQTSAQKHLMYRFTSIYAENVEEALHIIINSK